MSPATWPYTHLVSTLETINLNLLEVGGGGSAIICGPWMSAEKCVPFSYINYKARYFSALMKLGPRSIGRKPREQLLFVYLWSILFSACLWRHHRQSVYLSGRAAFHKILIISPPCLLAFALIEWRTSAGMELERWLKWQSKNRDKEQNWRIKLINVKAWLLPLSSLNHSLSFLLFIICSPLFTVV